MKIGVVNVERDILRSLTYKQLRGWQHYFELEVPEDIKEDYRAALIMQTMANLWGRGKGKPAYKVKDFLPKWDVPERAEGRAPSQALWKKLNIAAMMHAGEEPARVMAGPGEVMNSAPLPVDRTPGEVDPIGLALLKAREAMIKT